MKKASAMLIAGGLWFGAAYGAGVVATADFNGDRRADILWRNQGSGGTGENYLYPMNGTAILAGEGFLRTVADLSWQIVGVGDFDGDGKADILWRNSSTGQNYIYFMDATAIIGEGFIRTVADQNWRVAGVGDFDGDGTDDILWRHAVTGDNYLYPMNGLAIKPGEGFLRTVADLNWKIAGVGDFDGDGKADILWRNSANGQNYLYPMDGTTIQSGEGFLRTVADQNWKIAGVGDFDGDRNADIVWRNASTGDNYIYLMNGTAIAGEGFIRTVADLNWRIVAVGDYDGDGKTDLFWRHAVTGQTYLYPMDGVVIRATEGFVRTVSDAHWTVVPADVQPAVQPAIETGLEWSGNESTTFERRIVFANPFPIYPATYVFRVFPRKKAGPNPRYYTTFFWGNNGSFSWDGGLPNTYYGMHPYPNPPPDGPGQWEISVLSNDFVSGSEVQWDRWYTQVIRVFRVNASTTRHEFYWDWPDRTKLLDNDIIDPDWAARNPPKPAIVVGQAPNNGLGQSWGGYAGFEEFKGIIRGMQFYNSLLTLPQVESELATPGSVVRPWYLNLNPTPTDISDKSGSNHDPVWEGRDRPALWTNPSQ
jgi:FG-GAP-like repeat/FG-GAP repeat